MKNRRVGILDLGIINKIVILFVVFSLTSVTFSSCNKCKSKNFGTITFSQTDLNILPYNGAEKLIFKDSLNDSIIFNGKDRSSNFGNISYEHYHEYCAGDYVNSEINFTQFRIDDNDYGCRISLSIIDPFVSPHLKDMNLTIIYKKGGEWFFEGSFDFNEQKLTGICYSPNSVEGLVDTLTLGPKVFNNVYTLVQNEDPFGLDNLKTVYYSVSKGIVGFKSKDEHLWYLAN